MSEHPTDETAELLWQYIERLKEGDGATCHVRAHGDLEEMAGLVPIATALQKVMQSDAADARIAARDRLKQTIASGIPVSDLTRRPRPLIMRWNRRLVLATVLLLLAL